MAATIFATSMPTKIVYESEDKRYVILIDTFNKFLVSTNSSFELRKNEKDYLEQLEKILAHCESIYEAYKKISGQQISSSQRLDYAEIGLLHANFVLNSDELRFNINKEKSERAIHEMKEVIRKMEAEKAKIEEEKRKNKAQFESLRESTEKVITRRSVELEKEKKEREERTVHDQNSLINKFSLIKKSFELSKASNNNVIIIIDPSSNPQEYFVVSRQLLEGLADLKITGSSTLDQNKGRQLAKQCLEILSKPEEESRSPQPSAASKDNDRRQ